ncbi:NUDIX domain-containing protein [Candidatus Woesearchaeota archaeon]|jgi:8-oxo-dGTP pyrophosphatase MutT (NUDIX family)|nr:NUDIX domain-containing protein [Candidatus Woesearchaeota archaeon]
MAIIGKDYRNTALAIFRREDGKILIALNPRTNSLDKTFVDKNTYKFPQGGIDGNEEPLVALKREMHEELGLELEDDWNIKQLEKHISYWFRNENKPDFEIRLHAFLINVKNLDEKLLKVDPEEVAEVKWVDPKEVDNLELGIRHHAYLTILRQFELI